MKEYILILAFLLIGLIAQAQADTILLGKWDVCYQEKLDSTENCTTNSYVTYCFFKDGTYSDSREYIVMDKKYNYHGVWSYDGNQLIIDAADEHGFTIYPQKFKISWINKTLCYAKAKEGKRGPIVYTYFKKL